MPLRVAPSIIAGDQARLGEEVRAIEAAGADYVHLDVMDGRFVPNITLGPGVVADLRPHSRLPFDCHLMLAEPERYIEVFARAGADRIAVHVEVPGAAEALASIRALGRVPGIVVNPDTPPENASPFLGMADFAIVMTVHPGFYGQKLMPECLDKVAVLKDNARALGRELVVMIDGGVSIENASRIASAGADEVVAGAAVFKSADYRTAVQDLRQSGAQIGA